MTEKLQQEKSDQKEQRFDAIEEALQSEEPIDETDLLCYVRERKKLASKIVELQEENDALKAWIAKNLDEDGSLLKKAKAKSKNHHHKGDVLKLTCVRCGNKFTFVVPGAGKTPKYCKDCPPRPKKAKRERTLIEYRCLQCGETFKAPKTYNKHKRKYCSKECAYKAQSTQVMVKCDYCGKEFETFPSYIERRPEGQLYCSKKCYQAANRAPMTSATCAYCKKTFKHRSKNPQMYCCKKCYHEAQHAWRDLSTEGLLSIDESQWKVRVVIPVKGRGVIARARLIMENELGRQLKPYERVWHIDGNPKNDHPSNLRITGSKRSNNKETEHGQENE